MYLKRIVLENTRGFRSLDFDFERRDGNYAGWTVITGDNGSGKSTLLKAIALAIAGPDSARTLQPSLSGWISLGEDRAHIATRLVAGERDRFGVGKRYQYPFWAELLLRGNDGREPTLRQANEFRKGKKGPARGPWAENPEGWFCVGYGPFRRLYGHSPEAQRLMSTPGRIARLATLFREDATLAECELWLKELQHKELEGDVAARTTLAAVLKILNADFLSNGIQIDRVDSDGLWLRQRNNVTLSLLDMSDGYRAALAMAMDILRHLVDVYGPDDILEENEDSMSVPYSGIVLIDEIDAHLHPEWQRQIGFWLKRIFPKIQFIVTTHSPLICQAADDDGLFHLPAPGNECKPFKLTPFDVLQVKKGRPDEILLSPAFDLEHTRSPRVVQARLDFAKLRSKRMSVGLSKSEQADMQQLLPFVDTEDNEPEAAHA